MMQIPINLLRNDSLVHDEVFLQKNQSLISYVDTLKQASVDRTYSFPESSIFLPKDAELLETVKSVVGEKIKKSLPKYIVVIGIGGSNLGTKAVYDALFGYYDVVDTARRPVMIFLDTVEALFLEKTKTLLAQEMVTSDDVLIFIVSKSGSTTETIANAEILLASLLEVFPDINNRVITISDTNAPIRSQAEQAGITNLTLPAIVGGRYSVLSAVGLAPLFACGIDIEALTDGASDMVDVCLLTEGSENPAMTSATVLFDAMSTGYNVHDTFVFAPSLESLGKWYRQLLGESVGKEKDRDGNIVHVGITPTVSVGSTDLHSVGQLYLGGPKNTITSFVSLKDYRADSIVPTERVFPELVTMINTKTSKDITEAILQGIKESYRKNAVPFISIVLDDSRERSLGAFFQWKMMEMMYLGKLLNVNPFDQPNVESYKIETKKILQA